MRNALATRGVNVRPQKPHFESAAPHGLRISGCYNVEGSPGRPLPGYRKSDFGTPSRKRSGKRAVERAESIRLGAKIEDHHAHLRAAWEAADLGSEKRAAMAKLRQYEEKHGLNHANGCAVDLDYMPETWASGQA